MSEPLDLPAAPIGEEEWHTQVNPWLIAASVVLVTFMQVLDTTIIMVALPHIAGSMAASSSESTWTLTSYLVSNGIVVPMSAWLALKFGRKRLMLISTMVFVVSSMLCGLAPNLPLLIVARIFQGAGGGVMVPAAQAILLEAFPPVKRGMAMAVFGFVVVLAPIIGPTLGGWLTDTYSWRWAFYINVPVGLLSMLLMARFLEDPPWIKNRQAGKLDGPGFAFLAVWVGALQVVLDKGQDEDWFSSAFITRLSILTLIGLAAFILRELRTAEPMVDLRVFADRNFAVATLTIALVSAVLYSSAALLPQFLQSLLGYTAQLSGWAISPRGFGVLCATPLVGYLLSFMDGRKLIMFGLFLIAVSNYMLGRLSLEIGMADLVIANVVQGFGMGFIFVPVTTLSVSTLRTQQIGNATALFNLVRNVGGSIGLSVVVTFLVRAAQRRQNLLAAHLTPYDPAYQQRLLHLQSALVPLVGAPQASKLAHGVLYGLLVQQSNVLAFVDTYRWMAIAVVVCVPGALLMRKVIAGGRRQTH
jgi:DHA2 family multidrug resistance protein